MVSVTLEWGHTRSKKETIPLVWRQNHPKKHVISPTVKALGVSNYRVNWAEKKGRTSIFPSNYPNWVAKLVLVTISKPLAWEKAARLI